MGFRKTGEPLIDSASRYPEWIGSLGLDHLLFMNPTQNQLVILGLMEAIFHMLRVPTSQHCFCLDQTVFTVYEKGNGQIAKWRAKDRRLLKHTSKMIRRILQMRGKTTTGHH